MFAAPEPPRGRWSRLWNDPEYANTRRRFGAVAGMAAVHGLQGYYEDHWKPQEAPTWGSTAVESGFTLANAGLMASAIWRSAPEARGLVGGFRARAAAARPC